MKNIVKILILILNLIGITTSSLAGVINCITPCSSELCTTKDNQTSCVMSGVGGAINQNYSNSDQVTQVTIDTSKFDWETSIKLIPKEENATPCPENPKSSCYIWVPATKNDSYLNNRLKIKEN